MTPDQNKIGYRASEFIRGDKQDYSSFAQATKFICGDNPQSTIHNPNDPCLPTSTHP